MMFDGSSSKDYEPLEPRGTAAVATPVGQYRAISDVAATNTALQPPASLLSAREAYLQKAQDIREKLKEYLLAVEPQRLSETDRILETYNIPTPTNRQKGWSDAFAAPGLSSYQTQGANSPTKRMYNNGVPDVYHQQHPDYNSTTEDSMLTREAYAAKLAQLKHQEHNMFVDLVRYFRVPVSTVEDALAQSRVAGGKSSLHGGHTSLVAQQKKNTNRSWRQRRDEEQRQNLGASFADYDTNHKEENLTRPDAQTSKDLQFASPNEEHKRETVDLEGARAQYMPFGVNPSGFHRRDAICKTCGWEAINPSELKRHTALKHPSPYIDPDAARKVAPRSMPKHVPMFRR